MYLPFKGANLDFLTHAKITNTVTARAPHPIPANVRIYLGLPNSKSYNNLNCMKKEYY